MYLLAIRHPRLTLVVAATLVAAVSPGLFRLQLRTDGQALVPESAPETVFDREFRDRWDIQDKIVVVIDSGKPDGIYDGDILRALVKLTERLGTIDGLARDDVTSLATEKSDRVVGGTLNFVGFLDPVPSSGELMRRLIQDIQEIRIYSGTLVSTDASALAILLSCPPRANRRAMHLAIQTAIDDVGTSAGEIYLAGAPIAESQLGIHILEDLLGSHVIRLLARLGITEAVGDSFDVDTPDRFSLVLVALVLMLIVFGVAFGSLTAAVIPLVEVGACLILTFSLMGWLKVPVYLTMAVIPVILTAIGVADELHVFTRYRRGLFEQSQRSHLATLEASMSEMWRPIVKTSVTSATGFASFCLSEIKPVQAFGAFMAIGILLCMLWSLTVVPAWLALVKPRRFMGKPLLGSQILGFPSAVIPWVAQQRVAVLTVVAVCVIAAPFGIRRLVIQDSWMDAFSQESPLRQAMQRVNQKFFGAHLLLIEFDTGPVQHTGPLQPEQVEERAVRLPLQDNEQLTYAQGHRLTVFGIYHVELKFVGLDESIREVRGEIGGTIERVEVADDEIILHVDPGVGSILDRFKNVEVLKWEFSVQPPKRRLLQPEMIEVVGRLESLVRSRDDLAVGGVQGFHMHVSTTNYLLYARDESQRKVPDNSTRITRCLERYEFVRGKHLLSQLVDDEARRCTITVFLKNANFRDTATLIDAIKAYERQELQPIGVAIRFAGDVAVSQAMIHGIVRTQVQSLLLSLVGIVLVTTLLFRSIVAALFAVIPAGLAVLGTFAMMGWTEMPLGVATSMFSGMTIGIGVDFAIHLLERLRLTDNRHGDWSRRMGEAVSHVGPAIMIDAVAVALGFGVLYLSQVPANRHLGALVMLAIVVCLLATMVVIPALIQLLQPEALSGKNQNQARSLAND